MPHSHILNIRHLVDDLNLPECDMLDYSDNDPYQIVENFFQFCQTDLSTPREEYNILPALLYIRRSMEVNAAARKWNDYYIMRVNFGTLTTMFRIYTDRRTIFGSPELSDYKHLHDNLDASLDYLLFQLSIQFTYYHEKGHLIQVSPVENNWIQESYAYEHPENDPFELPRHMYEFDADIFGSTMIGFHLLQYWKKQPDELRTHENLNLLASIGITSILSYFIFLLQKYVAMYYAASTHPHPLIRISYIVDNLVKTVEDNLEDNVLDRNAIMERVFAITDKLFTSSGDNWVTGLQRSFLKSEII